MRVQQIGTLEELAPFAPHWDRLVERSGYKLPFSTFAWCNTWWHHLARNRASVRDRLSIRAVWDDRGELAAVAPFILTQRPAAGPLRMRWLHSSVPIQVLPKSPAWSVFRRWNVRRPRRCSAICRKATPTGTGFAGAD